MAFSQPGKETDSTSPETQCQEGTMKWYGEDNCRKSKPQSMPIASAIKKEKYSGQSVQKIAKVYYNSPYQTRDVVGDPNNPEVKEQVLENFNDPTNPDADFFGAMQEDKKEHPSRGPDPLAYPEDQEAKY